MNSKSKQVGIKIHNSIGRGFKAIGRGIAKGAKVTYTKALTPAGHGIKAGVVSAKDFAAGVVLGERDIAKEQEQLDKERAERMHLEPGTFMFIRVTEMNASEKKD